MRRRGVERCPGRAAPCSGPRRRWCAGRPGDRPRGGGPTGGGRADRLPEPAHPADAPDPDIVAPNGTYYAFTTGGAPRAHPGVPPRATSSTGSAVPAPGALVSEPWWVNPGLEWAPTVAEFGGTWVMLYATFDEWLDAECVTEATARGRRPLRQHRGRTARLPTAVGRAASTTAATSTPTCSSTAGGAPTCCGRRTRAAPRPRP